MHRLACPRLLPVSVSVVIALTCRWERRGVVVRFVVGHSDKPEEQRAMRQEAGLYGDIIRLPVQEGYSNLSNKTRAFFKTVADGYDAAWVSKGAACLVRTP